MFRAVRNAQIKSYVSNLGTVTSPAAILGASFAYKEPICRLSEPLPDTTVQELSWNILPLEGKRLPP